MKQEKSDIEKIRLLIKRLLKKHELTYKDLSERLNLSEASVKYFMTRGDLTFDKVSQVATLFGFTLLEFCSLAKSEEEHFFSLTEAQENFFFENPICFYLLLLLGAGLEIEKIRSRGLINPDELEASLNSLIDMKLVHADVHKSRLFSAFRGPFLLSKNGPIKQNDFPEFKRIVLKKLENEHQADELDHYFELYLTNSTRHKMQEELMLLFKKYARKSKYDHESSEEVFPFVGALAVRKMDGWGELLTQKANSQNLNVLKN